MPAGFEPSKAVRAGARRRGYSLLEVVCATAIVGSVSAAAVPRLSELPSDARVAVVQHMQGVVHEASSLAHMGCAVNPHCDLRAGQTSLLLDGAAVMVSRGYPAAGVPDGIEAAVAFTGFRAVREAGRTAFRKTGAPREDACMVVYEAPRMDGALPSIEAVTSGC